MTSTAAPSSRQAQLRAPIAAAVAAIVGALSIAWPKVSIVALVAAIASLFVLRAARRGGSRSPWPLALVAVAGMTAAIGFTRFVIQEAAPGIVEAGENVLAKAAMYRLREIRIAQDAMRSYAFVDPDGDHIGSAAELGVLTGVARVPGGDVLPNPPLHPRFAPDAQGVACVDSYCFRVFVPADAERAERRFVAYGWPLHAPNVARDIDTAHPNTGGLLRTPSRGQVLFIDEHERIMVSDNVAGYVGRDGGPAADAALSGADFAPAVADGGRGHDGDTWRAWRGKQPTATLKGDMPTTIQP